MSERNVSWQRVQGGGEKVARHCWVKLKPDPAFKTGEREKGKGAGRRGAISNCSRKERPLRRLKRGTALTNRKSIKGKGKTRREGSLKDRSGNNRGVYGRGIIQRRRKGNL